MKKISIVIPVYNCPEALLRRGLEHYDGVGADVEVLIIDDGSAEDTRNVLSSYEKSNPSVRVIRQENQGVSAARNRGVSEAQGEYIVFCDADDEADTGVLLKNMNFTDTYPDYVVFNYIKRTGDSSENVNLNGFKSTDECIRFLLYEPNRYGTVWAKAFRTDFLKTHDIKFDTKLTHGEDSIFILDCLSHGPYVSFVKDSFYTYNVNLSSAAKCNPDAVDNYIRMMEAGRQRVEISIPEHSGEYAVFCDINLLIMLVNYIFPKNGDYRTGKTILKKVLAEDIVNDALRSSQIKNMNIKNRIALFGLRHKMYFICYMLACIRSRGR